MSNPSTPLDWSRQTPPSGNLAKFEPAAALPALADVDPTTLRPQVVGCVQTMEGWLCPRPGN